MAYNPEVHDDDLTGEIIGVATEIHKKLGSDQSESTYRDVLAEGLRRADLNCEVEHEVDVEVYGFRAGSRRLDLFVEEEVALELKVTRNISDRHLQQPNSCSGLSNTRSRRSGRRGQGAQPEEIQRIAEVARRRDRRSERARSVVGIRTAI